MGGITAKQLSEMVGGTKVLVASGIYLRKNLDDTVTAWCRIKRNGKSLDIKAGQEHLPLAATALRELVAHAQQLRFTELKRKPTPEPMTQALLLKESTVGAVWADLLSRIDTNDKWTERTRATSVVRVKRYLEPSQLWRTAVEEVQPLHVANLLTPMASTPDQQKKVRGLLSLVFTHAMALGLRGDNPAQAAGAIMRVTSKAKRAKHFPTVTEWKRLRNIYNMIGTLDGKATTRQALALQALTCLRTSEVLGARWDEFALDAAEPVWAVARGRMKIKDSARGDHVVPLSAQAVALLKSIKPTDEYLFPGRTGKKPTSANTLPQALRRDLGLGEEFVPHSWRSAFRTMAVRAEDEDGRPLFAEAWLESVLDHISSNEVQAAYDRGRHVAGARRALQWWADQLTANTSEVL